MAGTPADAGAVVVLVACDTQATASRIAGALVEERLAACVTRVPGAVSLYRWEGKVEEAEEVLLLVKTVPDLVPAVMGRIAALHPYRVPEILSVPVADGFPPYLEWLRGEVGSGSGAGFP